MRISVELESLDLLCAPVVALAPQDHTGRGDLAPDSPEWVYVPVTAATTPADWWEGSDYEGKPRPDFIALQPPAVPPGRFHVGETGWIFCGAAPLFYVWPPQDNWMTQAEKTAEQMKRAREIAAQLNRVS